MPSTAWSSFAGRTRRAFGEFLAVPTCMVIGFLLLAAVTYAADHAKIAWLTPTRELLQARVFANAEATADLLGTVAGSIITVTSITISLLLLALQQSAASMTAQVFDQFLRRRHNQVYFGFFVGLALFSLVTLATVGEPFNPVYGASIAFLLTMVAMFLLIVLLYTTINQMRPEEIISAIHGHTLTARRRLLPLVHATRRQPMLGEGLSRLVRAERHGYVTAIDTDRFARAAKEAEGEVEVALRVSIGSFVGFGDVLAAATARSDADATRMADAVGEAVRLEHQRDIAGDPAFGIEELEMIAWTSISTSKSNPAPGLYAIRNLRDLLARWSAEDPPESTPDPVPVVYTDTTMDTLLDTFESLAVVSTESMQHQSFAEVMRTFTAMFERMSRDQKLRAEQVIRCAISGLGDHMLTGLLDTELAALAAALSRSGAADTARTVETARQGLGTSVGKLNSRSTRVSGGQK